MMKIKKKEYQKQLNDKYWQGVETGIRFALENPEVAKRSLNDIQGLRNIIDKFNKAFEVFSEKFKNIFEVNKDD